MIEKINKKFPTKVEPVKLEAEDEEEKVVEKSAKGTLLQI
jgi:hypothetical protein